MPSFRTPPPYNYGQTAASKSCKDLRSYSDHKQQVVSLSKYNTNGQVKSTAALQYEEVVLDDKKSNRELSWLDQEKFKYSNGLSEKYKISSDQDHRGTMTWVVTQAACLCMKLQMWRTSRSDHQEHQFPMPHPDV
ncbi:protein BIG GRAIN 1-like E [Prunus yedoensis var. nudiflora]|uniref:Protein BIG GRAIN 1-like E n=1 Tax=Prunus yedoensis var. nudiflora TaxID=2094558 RepID=A0A314YHE5_PRUYE|nr:protein BIG GRAIN 1-like E [Prunus yedoensis var. nudiflora]